MPEEGAITEVELRCGELLVRAECKEKAQAEATFATAREAGHRAALLTRSQYRCTATAKEFGGVDGLEFPIELTQTQLTAEPARDIFKRLQYTSVKRSFRMSVRSIRCAENEHYERKHRKRQSVCRAAADSV